MDSNQRQGHVVAVLIMIIALLAASLISILITQNIGKGKEEPKKTNTEENTNKKESSKEEIKEDTKKDNIVEKEEEVSVDKYRYLLKQLYPQFCSVSDLSDYINLNKMTDEMKIRVAMGMTDLFKNNTYKVSDIDPIIKKIFGKDTKVVHKSNNKDLEYNSSTQTYEVIPHGCGDYDKQWFQEITKVTTKDDKLYIYVIAGSILIDDDQEPNKICKDYNYTNCTSLNEEDKKYTSNLNLDIDYHSIQYATNNKDRFANYKYTFEKEDNNYIIKKLEKID